MSTWRERYEHKKKVNRYKMERDMYHAFQSGETYKSIGMRFGLSGTRARQIIIHYKNNRSYRMKEQLVKK